MPLVTEQVRDAVAHLTLDSPQTRNALSDALLDELIAALERARDDEAVRVVVLGTSHPTIFSAGGDLKAFADDSPTVTKYAGLDRFPRLYELIGALGKPVICAAGGDVLAGSFGLALACDLIVAREGVRFACPEINVGVFPFMISALIFRNLPRVRANELMMLGGDLSAEEAAAHGMVNRVLPAEEFEAGVNDLAQRLAAKSPLLMRLGKDSLAATRDLSLPEALSALRSQLALAFTTDDIKEGVAAFRERRDPVWSMR